MILVKVDEKDIKRIKPHSDLYKLLDEFITGGYDCAEIIGTSEHYSNTNSGQTTITSAIKRYKFNIRCFSVRGKIYLKRKEV